MSNVTKALYDRSKELQRELGEIESALLIVEDVNDALMLQERKEAIPREIRAIERVLANRFNREQRQGREEAESKQRAHIQALRDRIVALKEKAAATADPNERDRILDEKDVAVSDLRDACRP